jgi:hypothetical protein
MSRKASAQGSCQPFHPGIAPLRPRDACNLATGAARRFKAETRFIPFHGEGFYVAMQKRAQGLPIGHFKFPELGPYMDRNPGPFG